MTFMFRLHDFRKSISQRTTISKRITCEIRFGKNIPFSTTMYLLITLGVLFLGKQGHPNIL